MSYDLSAYDARDRQIEAIDKFIDALDRLEFMMIKHPYENKSIRAIIFHRLWEARAEK